MFQPVILLFGCLGVSGRRPMEFPWISTLSNVQSFGRCFSSNGSKPNKNLAKKRHEETLSFFWKKKQKNPCQLHHWQYSSRLPPELSQLSLFAIGLALMLQPHQVSLPHTSSSLWGSAETAETVGSCPPFFRVVLDGKKERKKLPVVLSQVFFPIFLIQIILVGNFWVGCIVFGDKPNPKNPLVGWSYVFTAARLPFRTNKVPKLHVWQKSSFRHPKSSRSLTGPLYTFGGHP